MKPEIRCEAKEASCKRSQMFMIPLRGALRYRQICRDGKYLGVIKSWGLEEAENEWRVVRDKTQIQGAKNVLKLDHVTSSLLSGHSKTIELYTLHE